MVFALRLKYIISGINGYSYIFGNNSEQTTQQHILINNVRTTINLRQNLIYEVLIEFYKYLGLIIKINVLNYLGLINSTL